MADVSQKNLPLSPAALSLGLGDMLIQQVEDQTAELKKKKQSMAPQNPIYGAAAMSLLGPLKTSNG